MSTKKTNTIGVLIRRRCTERRPLTWGHRLETHYSADQECLEGRQKLTESREASSSGSVAMLTPSF
jgi:hypothetical protein